MNWFHHLERMGESTVDLLDFVGITIWRKRKRRPYKRW
jgi:hypothetical protein